VPSQAVLHAGNYITMPEEPAQITSISAIPRVHLSNAFSALEYDLVLDLKCVSGTMLTIGLSQDVVYRLLDCNNISMQ
jgi:hypothetical protein